VFIEVGGLSQEVNEFSQETAATRNAHRNLQSGIKRACLIYYLLAWWDDEPHLKYSEEMRLASHFTELTHAHFLFDIGVTAVHNANFFERVIVLISILECSISSLYSPHSTRTSSGSEGLPCPFHFDRCRSQCAHFAVCPNGETGSKPRGGPLPLRRRVGQNQLHRGVELSENACRCEACGHTWGDI
jgi:hypothetical protein